LGFPDCPFLNCDLRWGTAIADFIILIRRREIKRLVEREMVSAHNGLLAKGGFLADVRDG